MSTTTPTNSNTITISPNPYTASLGGFASGGGGAGGASGAVYISSGGVGAGTMYTSSGTGSSSWTTIQPSVSMTTSILSIMAEGDGDAMIKTKKNTINLDEMATMMETLKERMLIVTPDFEKHDKYPALKEAYDNYKALEAMLSCTDDNK